MEGRKPLARKGTWGKSPEIKLVAAGQREGRRQEEGEKKVGEKLSGKRKQLAALALPQLAAVSLEEDLSRGMGRGRAGLFM